MQQLIHTAFRHLERISVCFLVDPYDVEVRLQGMLPLSTTTFIGAASRPRLLDVDSHSYERDEDGADIDYKNGLARTFPRAGQLFTTLRLHTDGGNPYLFHQTALQHVKKFSICDVDLDNKSSVPTSWEKTLKQIALVLFLGWTKLSWLRSDDIENVVPENPLSEAYNSRHAAYCEGLTLFLDKRGQTVIPGPFTSRDRRAELRRTAFWCTIEEMDFSRIPMARLCPIGSLRRD